MREIRMSGLMSGDGKRGGALRQCSRPSSTLPVPTATFRVLFIFLVLSHDRRRILHWNITEHPTEEWTVQQLREAFPWDEAPRYLRCDLRKRGWRNDPRDGHRSRYHGTAISLAKSVRGAADWIDSPRVFGSRHRLERRLVASHSAKLF